MNKCIDCKYLNESSSHCNSEVFCSKEIDELNADAYQQGREDAIDEIYRHIKAECNPYGSPTILYEIGCRMMTYLRNLKEQNDDSGTVKDKDNE